jgi:hypothetical protein
MIDGATTLLPIVTFDTTDAWDTLLRVAAPELDSDGLRRLLVALGPSAKCVVIERQYIDKDYRDTFYNFHSKRFSTPSSRCLRLHFFAEPVTRQTLRSAAEIQAHYLGYSVVRPTKPNCIGRTLVSHRCCHTRGVVACLCRESLTLQSTPLSICGFPFISQDADVTVCAQSALWMVARYYSNRYPAYPETFPFQLARLTEDYSLGRFYPSSGLYLWQMAEALRRLGFAPVTYSRDKYPDDFEHYMYTYIESGIPVLAATDRHVIVAFGHVSDYSRMPPCVGTFKFSSSFNQAFVVNDDNNVPYQILGRASPIPRNHSRFLVKDIQSFIAPLAEKIFLPAESFQLVATKILNRGDVGYKALSPTLAPETLLLRLFLTTARSFKRALPQRGMGNPVVEDLYRNLPLPHFIWVCEISHAQLYIPNHQILGEIIWDATRNAHEPDGWVAVHYPEVLVVDEGSCLNRAQHLVKYPLPQSSHYPVYKHNLYELDLPADT